MEGTKQEIRITSREVLNCDAVKDVEEFSGECVIINTLFGKLNVEGENLRIKELNDYDSSWCGRYYKGA